MNDYKWTYDGKNYKCVDSDGKLLHCFTAEQLENYRVLAGRLPLKEEVEGLLKHYEAEVKADADVKAKQDALNKETAAKRKEQEDNAT